MNLLRSSLLVISLGLVSCSSSEIGNGHCVKTKNGYDVCIKKEDIHCERGPTVYFRCMASGIQIDQAGKKSHWSTEEIWNDYWGWKGGWSQCDDQTRVEGVAAMHYGICDEWLKTRNKL